MRSVMMRHRCSSRDEPCETGRLKPFSSVQFSSVLFLCPKFGNLVADRITSHTQQTQHTRLQYIPDQGPYCVVPNTRTSLSTLNRSTLSVLTEYAEFQMSVSCCYQPDCYTTSPEERPTRHTSNRHNPSRDLIRRDIN